MAEGQENNSGLLRQACEDAYNKYPKSCSHAVWYVIRQYNADQQYMNANQLINNMAASPAWQEVGLDELSGLADKGMLVVGGAKADGNGHVIVVYPGPMKPNGGFSYASKKTGKTEIARKTGTYASAMSTSMGSWPGAKSKGEKTVRDPWGTEEKFNEVRFWKYVGPIKKKPVSAEATGN